MSNTKRICVIGAGAAGLCAARHASAKHLVPMVFEQSEVLGGTWVYTETTGSHPKTGLPIHSSMYKSLKTNLPKEVMAFPDFPFPASKESFLHHTEVLAYLESYADHFDLKKFIHYNTTVKHVVHSNKEWNVTVENLETGKLTTLKFEAVVVCNGHYSVPRIPDLPGLESFGGMIMHSHDYRTPEPFKNKTVAVLGAAASGSDIAIDICDWARKVYLCHNTPTLPSKFSDNLEQRKGIKKVVGSHHVQLMDGTLIEDVDVIFMCTGYHYSFPFLDQSCQVNINNRVISPLFKHMIHINFPSLCFIGIPIQICPFPQFDLQVQLFVKSICGEWTVPSKEDMNQDTIEEMKTKSNLGIAERHFHKMGSSQWDYNRALCQLANLKEIPRVVETLYTDLWAHRRQNLTTYKQDSFEIHGDTYRKVE